MTDAEDKVNNDSLVESEDTTPKVYELGYLLVSTIKEEDLGVSYGNLKELVSSFKGEVIADEMPKMITSVSWKEVKEFFIAQSMRLAHKYI